METESKSTFQKLRGHPTVRAASTYAVMAFITVQVISLIVGSFNLSESILQGFIWASVIGFPVVLVLSFIISSHLSTLKLLFSSLCIVVIGYLGWSFYWIQFVKSPQLEQAFSNDEYAKSWIIARDINNIFPFIPQVKEALDQLGWSAKIEIKQDNVDVFWRPYGSNEFEWEFLGTNLSGTNRLPIGPLQLRLEKEGYETTYVSSVNPGLTFRNFPADLGFEVAKLELAEDGQLPEGMVYVPGGKFVPAISGERTDPYLLSPFYIDKHEVTNLQFKKFIDSGGYENPRYWQDMDFIKEGVSLSFEEALELMKDQTGRSGPAYWELQDYPEGKDNFPVTGISWYEAQAYAKFMGNILPPFFHWAKAAFPADEWVSPLAPEMLSVSNFKGDLVTEVGTYKAYGPYGTLDMTGNVREWVWNIFGGRGMTLGGAVGEPEYTGFQANPMPRFDRSKLTGFRTVRLLNPADLNPFGDPINRPEPPPMEFYKRLDDEAFKLYSTRYSYGKRDLEPKVVYFDESHPDWIKEKVSISVGYNNERMDVLIFRPKNSFNAVPSVVVYPGLNYFRDPPDIDDINPGEYGLDFIIKSGRALVWPAFKGSLNRLVDKAIAQPSSEEQLRQFRDMMVNWRVDTSRTLDYLEERQEFSSTQIHYLGMSYGAVYTPIVLLYENRFKSAIFLSGGFSPYAPPHSDGIFYLDRVKTPIIMMNGEQDFLIPIESQEAMFNNLGTLDENKKYVLFKAGHWPLPRNQMINESLEWLENYEKN
ncbi:MAG: SUMF1/EgtB/PvdO family nonheme iron enzyme [Gammaproteobacteria bacterium]